jgi:hypothetical protein
VYCPAWQISGFIKNKFYPHTSLFKSLYTVDMAKEEKYHKKEQKKPKKVVAK